MLGPQGSALLESIEALGVRILITEYRHRPKPGTEIYVSSRYVLDAMLASLEGQPAERTIWLTDLDCVWADPARVFAEAPPADEIGCIYIEYPPDWDTVGFEVHGRTRRAIGDLAAEMGDGPEVPPWVGGELLAGRPAALRALVAVCEELDARLAADGRTLPNEEQILSLAGALGMVRFRDLSAVARRITTGRRSHGGPGVRPPFARALAPALGEGPQPAPHRPPAAQGSHRAAAQRPGRPRPHGTEVQRRRDGRRTPPAGRRVDRRPAPARPGGARGKVLLRGSRLAQVVRMMSTEQGA